jgi:hypothetical protein
VREKGGETESGIVLSTLVLVRDQKKKICLQL